MKSKVKIIKRYQNRKLYDTTKSCYITLEDLAQMIRNGDDVVVLDNKTKKDITASTLTQIIFETEKKSKRLLPNHLLKDIIKGSGGSISHFFQKTVKSSVKEFVHVKDEIQKRIESVTSVPLLHKEIDRLHKKVKELQDKLERVKP